MEPRTLLNWVANQPEVLPHIAPGYARLNLSMFFADKRNIMLGDERGVLLFVWKGSNVYHMHYLFTSALRGVSALRATRTALKTMFTSAGASAIEGYTPRENRAARVMNRALGGRPIGEFTDIHGRPCIHYRLERASWDRLLATSLEHSRAPSSP